MKTTLRSIGFVSLLVFAACGGGGGGHGGGDGGADDDAAGSGTPQTVHATTYVDGAATNVTWAVYQDGDGAWQAATGTAGAYSFTVTSGRYSFAALCQAPTDPTAQQANELHLVHATVAELPSPVTLCTRASAAPDTLSGSITGLGTNEDGAVFAAGNQGDGSSDPDYTLDVEGGTYDVLAFKFTTQPTCFGRCPVSKLIVQHDVAVSAAQTLNFDLGANGTALESHTVTAAGSATGEDVETDVSFVSNRGTSLLLNTPLSGSASAGFVPTAAMTGHDTHLISAVGESGSGGTAERSDNQFKQTPADASLTLPTAWSAAPTATATGTSTAGTYPIFAASWAAYSGSVATVILGLSTELSVYVTAGNGWLGSATKYTVPDLSTAPGWQTAYAAEAHTSTFVSMRILEVAGNQSLANIVDVVPSIVWTPPAPASAIAHVEGYDIKIVEQELLDVMVTH